MLEFCLATIGVCVFRCVASVTHFFIEVDIWRSIKEHINFVLDQCNGLSAVLSWANTFYITVEK